MSTGEATSLPNFADAHICVVERDREWCGVLLLASLLGEKNRRCNCGPNKLPKARQ